MRKKNAEKWDLDKQWKQWQKRKEALGLFAGAPPMIKPTKRLWQTIRDEEGCTSWAWKNPY